ncbi:S26 family signal peptidase [Mycoplasmopsis bovirhinis]|uniref:signal peptidase I n=1 Tax=Mycoplasmopsis bovirhinis TaxID=29553 RepID=UPI000BB9F0BA|nr:signal peptidase I [Mycoplasmopsis bovirhinis]BBA22077.1 S26 family signal peptidase [Mycoplasmopsis bovirhinis]
MIRKYFSFKKLLKSWIFWVSLSFIILLSSLLIFFEFYTIIRVNGDSMNPTLHDQQLLLAKKSKSITYNTIAIFNFKDQLLIKRVIGLPGDNIKIQNEQLFLNGKFLLKLNNSSFDNLNLIINQNNFFALGDNLANSLDSRHFGTFFITDITAILP